MTKRAAEAVPPPLGSSRVGPDFIGYYRDQVAELLSKEERIPNHELGVTSSTEVVGAKLDALLRQSVWDIIPEVDEMQSCARSMHLMLQLKNKKPPTIPEDPTYKELDKMEQELGKLLDIVVTTCSNRPMSHGEKRNLQKSIKELPEENLVRVTGIIRNHYAALGKEFSDEVVVNMEEEDKVMLWRLHYYIMAVKSARELAR